MAKLNDYLQITKAAEFLGVFRNTLRNVALGIQRRIYVAPSSEGEELPIPRLSYFPV